MAFVDELLEFIRYEFVNKVYPTLTKKGEVYLTLPNQFDQHFQLIFKKWEQKTKELAGPKKMQTFDKTKKGQKVKEKKGDSTPSLTKSTSTPVRNGEDDKDDSTTNKSV